VTAKIILSRKFNELKLEYISLMCSLMELATGLYMNVETELWAKGSCMGGTGPKGQKYECGGPAAIQHQFSEAKKQEVVDHKLQEKRSAISHLTNSLSECLPMAILTASAAMEDCVE
jgi:hypothetical protein